MHCAALQGVGEQLDRLGLGAASELREDVLLYSTTPLRPEGRRALRLHAGADLPK
jgi:hypothetical protein